MKKKAAAICCIFIGNISFAYAQIGEVSLANTSTGNQILSAGNQIGKSSFPTCSPANFSCYPLATISYIFTGSGNWNIDSNWLNNIKPPALLPAGTEIIIDGKGECILNVPQTITAETKLTIMPGKKFRVDSVATGN